MLSWCAQAEGRRREAEATEQHSPERAVSGSRASSPKVRHGHQSSERKVRRSDRLRGKARPARARPLGRYDQRLSHRRELRVEHGGSHLVHPGLAFGPLQEPVIARERRDRGRYLTSTESARSASNFVRDDCVLPSAPVHQLDVPRILGGLARGEDHEPALRAERDERRAHELRRLQRGKLGLLRAVELEEADHLLALEAADSERDQVTRGVRRHAELGHRALRRHRPDRLRCLAAGGAQNSGFRPLRSRTASDRRRHGGS